MIVALLQLQRELAVRMDGEHLPFKFKVKRKLTSQLEVSTESMEETAPDTTPLSHDTTIVQVSL